MSFSRAQDRFSGPNSFYNISDPSLRGNNSKNQSEGKKALLPRTPISQSTKPSQLLQARTAVPTMRYYDYDEAPYYTRPTASSAQKTTKELSRRVSERLKFIIGNGADSLGSLPKFGSETKGGRGLMEKGRHGRFSMVGSYLVESRGHGSDYCGVGHKEYAPRGYDLGKSKEKRFEGIGSIYKHSKDLKCDIMLQHGDMLKQNGSVAGTAAFARGKLDKSEWLRANTCLSDRDMSQCLENQELSHPKSDFDPSYSNGSAVFKDASKRFPELKQDPGLSSLGPNQSEFQRENSCGVVYKRDNKHSRFSEFGGLHYNLSNSHKTLPQSVTHDGMRFAAQVLRSQPGPIIE